MDIKKKKKKKGSHWGKLRWLLTVKSTSWWLYLLRYYQTHLVLGTLVLLLLLLSHFSRVQLRATPWTAAHQASLSMGFSRQEYWSGLPFPSSGTSIPGCKPLVALYWAASHWKEKDIQIILFPIEGLLYLLISDMNYSLRSISELLISILNGWRILSHVI